MKEKKIENRTFVVYEKYMKKSGKVVYVGMGCEARAYEKYRTDEEFNKLEDDGYIATRLVFGTDKAKVTKKEALNSEELLIAKYGSSLYNRTKGTSYHEKDGLDDISKKAVNNEDTTTPDIAMAEIFASIAGSKDYDPENKKILEPNGRVEILKYFINKWGIENVENNYTMLKNMKGNINGECEESMNNILIINKNFDNWNTKEKYDVIIMNPPFKKWGIRFIIQAMGMLNDKGFLGCVMSPTWRSVVTEEGQKNKAYTQMVEKGGFHYIHMYSKEKTSELFNQDIGQVDVFVWQKGVKAKAEMVGKGTEIINIFEEKYYYDLTNYTQTVPVMSACIYDMHFNQINGCKWYKFGHPRDGYGSVDIEFIDEVTGKTCLCNKKNVEKTKGKKVVIDRDCKRYYVDNTGDNIVNQNYMFFFDTDEERDNIIKALDYVIDNKKQDLFKNRGRFADTYIPGIKK